MIRYLIGAALSMACSLALAAGSATIANDDGSTVQIEYDGDRVRLELPEGDGYMVVRDGRMYSVSGDTVFDVSSVFEMFADQISLDPADEVEVLHELRPTGRTETIAGVRGEVYIVDYTDENGQRAEEEVVLSSDRRAVELREAFETMARAVASATDQAPQKELTEAFGDRGVLRFGDSMKVSSLSDRRPAAARFDLPSEPQDMEGIGQAISEAFGGKSERQKRRVEQRTESETDRATDRAVDKALDKAFGKLFGR